MMKDFLREQINYLSTKFGWWISYYIPSVKGKHNMMINALLFCIIVLVVLLLFNPGMEDQKRFFIFLIIVIAAVNLFILLYTSSKDEHPPAAMRTSYQGFQQYPSTSPFNPRTEESSKRLLRETSEMLESQSKGFAKRPSFLYDTSIAQKDSSISRRKLDYSRREEVSPYGRTTGYAANNQSLPNIVPSSVFQPFNQGQSANRSTLSSRNVRDVPIPPMFSGGFRGAGGAGGAGGTGAQSPLNQSTRYNNHMYEGNARKASDYAYSTSPMRGTTNVRKPYSYMEGRSLIDEQFGSLSRETSMQIQNEKDSAEEQLVKLKIISQFHDWKKNCQRWFQARLIPKILDSNIANIKELNRIIGYFDKRLYEYEFILKLDQGRTAENIGQKPTSTIINMINIDELLNYETSFRTGGPLWPSTQLSASDIHRAHQDLIHLVQTRRQLEKYFEIPSFRPFEVRTHILERLFRLRGDFTGFVYNPDGARRRHPTDTQILSHLFFTFLNIEAAAQTDDKEQIYRNFVFKSNTNTVPSNIGNEDVYFRQTSPDGYEPQYDIVSGKEIWKVYPGLENLFCAIVLFVWHIKTKKHGTLGFEESKTFKEFMQTVIP